MSAINDGGPAFPIPHSGEPGSYDAHPGMSLRDHFGGQALIGVLIAEGAQYFAKPEKLAQTAWSMADAMIAARSPTPVNTAEK